MAKAKEPEGIYLRMVPAAGRGPEDRQALHRPGGGAVPCGGDHAAGPWRERQRGGGHSFSPMAGSVDRDIPLHLSRFFPRYRMMDKLSTPVERVYRLADVAREYLSFVYTGNC